jgi:hypothetical protein
MGGIKVRGGSPNPISFHNVGNHRLFLLSEVHEWVMKSPKIIHSRHRRRTKDEIAAVKVKQEKKALGWWASKDLNLQPADYESDALTRLS